MHDERRPALKRNDEWSDKDLLLLDGLLKLKAKAYDDGDDRTVKLYAKQIRTLKFMHGERE